MASAGNVITKHDIFMGGERTRNHQQSMFPQKRPSDPFCYLATANHKGDVTFANTRRLSLLESRTAERLGSPQLRQYFRMNPVGVDHELCTHLLPGQSEMQKLHVLVNKPVPGLIVDFCIQNDPFIECPDNQPEDFSSNVGNIPTGTPVPIATGVDLGVQCSWAFDVPGAVLAAGGTPPPGSASPGVCAYFKATDALIMKIKEVPADADPDNVLECLDIRITPIMREFCRGFE